MEWIKIFNYIALYGFALILVILFAIALPNIIEEEANKLKVRKLADKISKNQDMSIYNIDLLQNLLKGEMINVKYIRFLLLQLIKKAHDEQDKEKLIFFNTLNNLYNSNELYNQLPPQYKNIIDDLRKQLGSNNEGILSNLANSISELVSRDDKSSKINKFLTILSILVTLVSIVFPFINIK